MPVDGATSTRPAVAWLLAHPEPAIRYLTRRDVLGDHPTYDPDEILSGTLISGLLRGQERDGGFGVHPYRKWTGGFWRVVSLAELSAPGAHPQVAPAVDNVLDWLTGPTRRTRDRVVRGLTRHCATQDGLGVAAACRLGCAEDPRVERLARWLVEWQWPDGGWNCDVHASGRRSSFHETHGPIDGLSAYAAATGSFSAREAANAGSELLLDHHLIRPLTSKNPADVMNPDFLRLRFPAYWHYDVLRGLVVLARAGHASDPRTADAHAYLESRRTSEGLWKADGAWWRPAEASQSSGDVVDWGRRGPNPMITLQVLITQRAAGRLAGHRPLAPVGPIVG